MSEHDGGQDAAAKNAADHEAAGDAAADPEAAADPDEAADQDDAGPRKDQRAKQHEPFDSGGAESTREMREVSRRRRDAEGKLQQHLQEAKEKPAED
ncbi:hypothetical protein AB4089_04925 [Arthrobacter sp. 2MCAF15]|uniref:hypothetical protein n=1 Tax=Arthrobacter sp. 2MCAF15 TaxID=3232984 RepID=UPI003F8E48FD